VKVSYRQTASDDLLRQFRYYLVTQSETVVRIRGRALASYGSMRRS
jgi:hypothetical protein